MSNPNSRDPKTGPGQHLPIVHPPHHISFDLGAFDRLIASQGVRVRHLKAIPDPRALVSQGDYRRNENVADTDGNIYKDAGFFTTTFLANDKTPDMLVEGELDASQAVMSPPRFYDSDPQKRVTIDLWDRFEIMDIELLVTAKHLMTTTKTGYDRLRWPAKTVEYLIGSDGYEYKEGTHFQLKNGNIKWISQKRPQWNLETGIGEAYSIRYLYVPYFVVRRFIHEIRVAQVTNPQTQQRYVERLPYQVQVARENIFRDKMRPSEGGPVQDPRYTNIPAVPGSWSPGGSGGGGIGTGSA